MGTMKNAAQSSQSEHRQTVILKFYVCELLCNFKPQTEVEIYSADERIATQQAMLQRTKAGIKDSFKDHFLHSTTSSSLLPVISAYRIHFVWKRPVVLQAQEILFWQDYIQDQKGSACL